VLADLPKLVLKNIYPSPEQGRIFASQLDADGLAELRQRVLAQPAQWVGQEEFQHSLTPAWRDQRLVMRHMVLRTFACGNPINGYRVMPGGLTRFGASDDELVVSNQDGGISKDTWILSSEPERERLNREAVLSVGTSSLANAPLPAAAAENLFWAGRYQERALVLIRRLRDLLALEPLEDSIPLELSQALSCASGGLWKQEKQPREQLASIVFDPHQPGSIAFDLHWLVWNGRCLRGVISGEILGVIQRLGEVVEPNGGLELGRHLDTLSMQLRALSSLYADWSIDDPRRVFSCLGQRSEWLQLALGFLQSIPPQISSDALRLILDVDQGAPPGLVQIGDDVIRQAVEDARRPRSLASTVEAILQLLERLPRQRAQVRGRPEAIALRMLSSLALGNLDGVSEMLMELHSSLHETYFVAPVAPSWLQN
ncbi:MAG TPA: alpha-E domain-containing protein, partial [Fibrobacteraceae bacterium]|nr:alpha-E domain-containing protein [Fibrobacteraceae bacterium]